MGMELYYRYQSQLKMSDLIEFRSEKIFPFPLGYAIRFFTGQYVNHTSGILLKQLVGDIENRRYIGEAVRDGFRNTYLSNAISNYKGKVYWISLKDEYNDKRLAIAKRAQSLEGRPYDYKSLFLNAIKRQKISDGDVYCSEAWHIAYRDEGLIPYNFSPTGKLEDAGCGLRPGEFGRTGLFKDPVLIYSN